MSFDAAVHAKAIQLCKMTLDMTAEAGSGHPTTSMSLAHVTTVLMYHAMRWSPDAPDLATADRLVLSEGHAVPVVYAAYADLGGRIDAPEGRRPLTTEDLASLRDEASVLDGHPNPMVGFPFFDAATGSLGQGLSVAAGLALSARLDGTDRRIFCIVGDGEAREGQITEALDFIIDHELDGVVPIFNCNGHGQADTVSPQQSPERLGARLRALGFHVEDVDGHDPSALRAAIARCSGRGSDEDEESADEPVRGPAAVIVGTVKGWGSTTMQQGNRHGRPPKSEELDRARTELAELRNELVTGIGATDMQFRIYPPAGEPPTPVEGGDPPSFRAFMDEGDMAHLLHAGSMATRKAYGHALRALGHVHPGIVVLDADVRNSTYAETFAKDAALAERFFEGRIAEQNLMSVGAGLGKSGRIPFCSTFAKFVTRAYDQIEMAINSGANLKIVGSHAGISLAADGPSQMALPDVAWFRAFTTMKDHRGNPGCWILQPSDAYAAYALTMPMAEYEGVCYMRTLRPDTEFLYDDSTVFNLGGFEVLNEGRDLLVVASGYMVHEANRALDGLDRAGIDATLVDLYSLPFETERLLDLAQANGGNIITLEDNYGGGIGSAVADALTEDGGDFTLEQMHVRRIPKSARTPDEILRQCGLHHEDIVKTACRVLQVAHVG